MGVVAGGQGSGLLTCEVSSGCEGTSGMRRLLGGSGGVGGCGERKQRLACEQQRGGTEGQYVLWRHRKIVVR